MAIADFPSDLQIIIQQKMLEREFVEGIHSKLAYSDIAEVEEFSANAGETITKTKTGQFSPTTDAMNPAANTNLDNGLTPQFWAAEQYTLALNMYGATTQLNVITQKVGIKKRFIENARKIGTSSKQSMDRLVRNAIFDGYMGGNTRVRTTLGAPGNTVAVDDIRGFTTVVVQPNSGNPGAGTVQPVSNSNPLPVTVGENVYNVVGFLIDTVNVSTAFRGISGSLIFATNVTVLDGTLGNAVISAFAPVILRPNARKTTRDLVASDTLTLQLCLDTVSVMRDNNVPDIDGRYNMYLDNRSALQLFADQEFQLLYRGTGDKTDAYKNADVVELLDIRFIRTTEAPQQLITNSASNEIRVHRPILCGAGAIVEGRFDGLTDAIQNMGDNEESEIVVEDGIAMVTRPPIDRLRQIVSQSWYTVKAFAAPTDVTATQDIIPTANDAYLKRAIMLEVGSPK